jgi:hypothetical protein
MCSKKFLIILFVLFFLVTTIVIFAVLSSHRPDTRYGGVATANRRMYYINSAISQYYVIHGSYPFSDESKFLISWRALIFPFLSPDEYDQLVKMGYSPNMSWNSEVNAKAREYFPFVYRSIYNHQCKNTVIVAIKSERGIFSKGDEIPLDAPDNVRDLDNILSFIEIADSDINWLEPRDLTEMDLNKIHAVHKIDSKDCIVVSMVSGRGYVLTIENFRQVFSTLITVERNKKIIKEQNGYITTIKIDQ